MISEDMSTIEAPVAERIRTQPAIDNSAPTHKTPGRLKRRTFIATTAAALLGIVLAPSAVRTPVTSDLSPAQPKGDKKNTTNVVHHYNDENAKRTEITQPDGTTHVIIDTRKPDGSGFVTGGTLTP